jgi:hypothetical protein
VNGCPGDVVNKDDDAKEGTSWRMKVVKVKDGEGGRPAGGEGEQLVCLGRKTAEGIYSRTTHESESSAFPSFHGRKELAIPHDDP